MTVIALSCLIFLLFAFGGFAYWFATDPVYRAAWYGWRESMRVESARHPASLRNVVPWLAFFFATSPLILITLPFGFISEWRGRRLSPMLLLAILGLLANLLLLFNYSTSIGWRYLLAGLPALASGRRFTSVVVTPSRPITKMSDSSGRPTKGFQ